jgi:hypothetical protein
MMELTTHTTIWRGMAEEARAVAARQHDPELRRQMLILAAKYEALARMAQASALRGSAANTNELPDDGA